MFLGNQKKLCQEPTKEEKKKEAERRGCGNQGWATKWERIKWLGAG
jgi:hypothetical protein